MTTELTSDADGSEKDTWIGKMHRAQPRKEYTVPENAANHTSLRGMTGVCTKAKETPFGRSWAFMEFKGETAIRKWVRTCYLLPADGSPIVPLSSRKGKGKVTRRQRVEHPIKDKMARIWAKD